MVVLFVKDQAMRPLFGEMDRRHSRTRLLSGIASATNYHSFVGSSNRNTNRCMCSSSDIDFSEL